MNTPSKQELHDALHAVLANAFVNIDTLGRDLRAMNLTEAEARGEITPERNQKARVYIGSMTLINDVIHPAMKLAKLMFPEDAHAFIDMCMQQREAAITNKLIPECTCCIKK